ncbi:MAG: endopeptidase La [Succinivibrionaceae bacterium]|nr:endopeptidase La [Succinivibrionaceae bacterium]
MPIKKKAEARPKPGHTAPLLTLRGSALVAPGSMLKITAARPGSVAAIAQAKEHPDPGLCVFFQREDSDEAPKAEALHPMGVLCNVISSVPQEDGSELCLIKGLKRIVLESITEGKVRRAQYSVPREKAVKDEEAQPLLTMLRACLDYAVENQGKSEITRDLIGLPQHEHIISGIRSEQSLSRASDLLLQTLTIDRDEKIEILSLLDPRERARILIARLNGYSYRSELERRMVDDAHQAMERNQKEYFLNEQLKAIKRELKIDQDDENDISELRKSLRRLKAPDYVKARLEKEIKKFQIMSGNSSESAIVRNYIDTVMEVPWSVSSKTNTDIRRARDVLDEDHYGLDKVKDRILEYLAVYARKQSLHGPILCLMGPPGIGKTSLGASIARATGRKYTRVSLGGLHDEAEIRGHRRTYIGSMPGRIIQNLIKCGVNNPLFLLDEIDKITSSVHGDPAAALLEVLDPEQNSSFSDNYIDLDYDLSNVLFVTTANSYNIAQPLLDRMEIIDLSSYTEDEKFHIATEHLIPKQLKENALTKRELSFTDEAVYELIRYYTHEAGVRGLERIINELCRKTVKEAMLEGEGKRKSIKPRSIDVKEIERHLGPRRHDFTSRLKENRVGVVNGLAWTALGGDIMQLEVIATEGKGKHRLTGKLGTVMKESIAAAMTLVRASRERLHLGKGFYNEVDLHVHAPEGAVPKDGPSAGVGMVTGIVSALTGNPVRCDVAMTGEITLRGDILPIGGLKEKLLAALRGGIRLAIIPKENEKDLFEVPQNVKDGLEIHPVGRIEEVLDLALEHLPQDFAPTTCWAEGAKPRRARRKKAKEEEE